VADVAPGERDAPAGDGGEAEHGPAQGGLTRAGLADEADGLAGADVDGDARQGPEGSPADAPCGVVDDQVVDDEQWLWHA
jgi:hypothetical protein